MPVSNGPARSDPRVVIIIQARMLSDRLPGKVLMEVAGTPLLGYQLDSLERVKNAHRIVVATSTLAEDDPIASYCRGRGIAVYRGSETDVLERFYLAAQEHQADVIVRNCADCPLIDAEVVERVLQHYLEHRDLYDYVSNVIQRSYPRGMDTEVFSFRALEIAYRETEAGREREHVTLFMYEHADRFRLHNVCNEKDLSHYRWTVDEADDFLLVRHVLLELQKRGLGISIQNVLGVLIEHPEWSELNAHVSQKVV